MSKGSIIVPVYNSEKYLGDCTIDTICHEEIVEYMNDIGYIANNLNQYTSISNSAISLSHPVNS